MTEAEWLACDCPQPMLEFLQRKPSDGTGSQRKMRLFAVACIRRVWDLVRDDALRQAIESAERHAEGLMDDWALLLAYERAQRAVAGHQRPGPPAPYTSFDFQVAVAAAEVAQADASQVARRTSAAVVAIKRLRNDSAEPRAQAQLLRCLFIPFRSATLDPAWNSAALRNLAAAIDELRSFENLPMLAEALRDAGCTDAALLDHCDSGTEHGRGCWVVDRLLGKA